MRTFILLCLCSLFAAVVADLSCPEYGTYLADDNQVTTEDGRIKVIAAGASFPNRLYQRAIFAYQFVNSSIFVSYTSTGSGGGKCRIQGYGICSFACDSSDSDHRTPYEIDFAGSDSLLKEEDYTRTPDLQMYPAVAGSVVPIYNIPGIPDLVLTTDIIAKIFRKCEVGVNYTTGPPLGLVPCDGTSIRFWNDTAIVDLNPDYASILQAAGEITVVVREDGSGTTEIFRTALAAFEQQFADQVGVDSDTIDDDDNLLYNADVVRAARNSGVAARVQGTPFSIGYSVLGEAIALGIDFASIKKGDNVPIVASAETTNNAVIEKGLQFQEPVERFNAEISNALGSSAWPIAGYTYFVIRKNFDQRGNTTTLTGEYDNGYQNRFATFEFLEWFYTAGALVEQIADDLGFAVLSDNVKDFIVGKLREQFEFDGTAVYIPPEDNTISVELSIPATFEPVFNLYQLSYSLLRPNIQLTDTVDQDFRDPVAYLNARQAGLAFYLGNGPTLEGTQYVDAIASDPNLINIPYAVVGMGAVYSLCSTALQECGENETAVDQADKFVLDYITLARVLDGTIDEWNHEDIVALNPDLASVLPPAKIQVIAPREDDALSTTFTLAMKEVKNDFDLRGASDVILENSTQRLRSLIAQTEYAIGYTTLAESIPRLVHYVSIRRPGETNDVTPSATSLKNCAKDTYQADTSAFLLTDSQEPDCYPLVEVINIASKASYSDSGLSASDDLLCDGGDGVGAQAVKFLGFLYQEVTADDLGVQPNSVESPLETQVLGPILQVDDALKEINSQKLLGVACDGTSILNPPENRKLIPQPVVIAVLIYMICHILACLWFSRKVAQNKRIQVIRNSSPLFLQEALVGSVFGVLALIPLSMQDGDGFLDAPKETLDITCQFMVVFYTMGFGLMYTSIWLKTWRLNKIFNNLKLRKLKMENRRLQTYQLFYMLFIVILNILWWAIAPLEWIRVNERFDSDGNVLESYAFCTNGDISITPFLAAFALLFCVGLGYGVYLLYTIWFIPNEFNESKWIAFSLILSIQSLLLALAAIQVVGTDPITRYLIFVFVIFATLSASIMFLFIPKVSGIKGMTQSSFVDAGYNNGSYKRYQTDDRTGSDKKKDFSYSKDEETYV